MKSHKKPFKYTTFSLFNITWTLSGHYLETFGHFLDTFEAIFDHLLFKILQTYLVIHQNNASLHSLYTKIELQIEFLLKYESPTVQL